MDFFIESVNITKITAQNWLCFYTEHTSPFCGVSRVKAIGERVKSPGFLSRRAAQGS